MKRILPFLGLIAVFAAAARCGFWLAESLTELEINQFSRTLLAIYSALIGVTTLLIKDVQSLDPKSALSDVGLERVRRAQQIALRRLAWMFGLSVFGILLAALSSFGGSGNLLFALKSAAFPVSVAIAVTLCAVHFSYSPKLFFEIQRARTKLADMSRLDEERKNQLGELSARRRVD